VASTPSTVSDTSVSSSATLISPVTVCVGADVYTPLWSTVSPLQAATTTTASATAPRRSLFENRTRPPPPAPAPARSARRRAWAT
jgi:hypothetical protein